MNTLQNAVWNKRYYQGLLRELLLIFSLLFKVRRNEPLKTIFKAACNDSTDTSQEDHLPVQQLDSFLLTPFMKCSTVHHLTR